MPKQCLTSGSDGATGNDGYSILTEYRENGSSLNDRSADLSSLMAYWRTHSGFIDERCD